MRSGHPKRQAREHTGGGNGQSIDVATTIGAKGGTGRSDFESETFVMAAQECAADVTHALKGEGHDASEDGTGRGVMPAVAFNARQDPDVFDDHAGPLDTDAGTQAVQTSATAAVRRLTPRECERLQGFPDDHTDVPFRGKAAADGPRYKALGNSIAVPCLAHIGVGLSRALGLELVQKLHTLNKDSAA